MDFLLSFLNCSIDDIEVIDMGDSHDGDSSDGGHDGDGNDFDAFEKKYRQKEMLRIALKNGDEQAVNKILQGMYIYTLFLN